MKYTKTLFFYLNNEELKDLDEEVDLAGITRSQYVRRCINETVMKHTVNISYCEFIRETNELIERFRVVADRAWHSRVLDVPMFRKVIQDTQILMTKINDELIKEINVTFFKHFFNDKRVSFFRRNNIVAWHNN